jgi:uncharacterized protein (DUF4415 family)
MREKNPGSIVRSKPDGTFVLVHADGHEEPYRPAASDLAKIDATTDEDIVRQIAADLDIAPELPDEWFDEAELRVGGELVRRRPGRPKSVAPKKLVALRLDPDVIEGFRAGGAGWQSRINAVLRQALGTLDKSGHREDAAVKKRKRETA